MWGGMYLGLLGGGLRGDVGLGAGVEGEGTREWRGRQVHEI